MPLVKEPIWLFHTIEQLVNLFILLFINHFHFRFLSEIPAESYKFEIEEDRQIYHEIRSLCNFTEEFENLK